MALSLRSPALLPRSENSRPPIKTLPSSSQHRRPPPQVKAPIQGHHSHPQNPPRSSQGANPKIPSPIQEARQSQPYVASSSDESVLFETIKAEYRAVAGCLELKGRRWERRKAVNLEGFGVGKAKGEYLEELRKVLEKRNGENFRWVLDDGVEEVWGDGEGRIKLRENISEDEKFRLLVKRFVYMKLISVLGKTRRPIEDCQIFSLMQEDGKLIQLWPPTMPLQ